MASQKFKITFLNGMITTLSTGEINAIEAYAIMNGTDPASPQYHPGNVHHTTTRNLVAKGIFVMGKGGVPSFAPGVLPVVGRTTHSASKFSLTGALAAAANTPETTEMRTLAAEDFQVGYRYWPVRPGYEAAWTIKSVTVHPAPYQVQREGKFVTPMLVTHVRGDGTERSFEKGEKIAIQGPWKTQG
jgi:hypothetical protein